jgi:hypothetical protein
VKCFTTCVNYADFLAVTLPAWKRFGQVIVITRSDDEATHRLCETQHVLGISATGWFIGGTGLNKGAAMDQVIPDWALPYEQIVVFDADSYPIGTIPNVTAIDCLLGCRRFACHSSMELQKRLENSSYPLKHIAQGTDREHLARGYFQSFLYHTRLRFGNTRHTMFSGCDMYLASQFVNEFLDPDVFHVLHLGRHHVNWKGRVTPRWM